MDVKHAYQENLEQVVNIHLLVLAELLMFLIRQVSAELVVVIPAGLVQIVQHVLLDILVQIVQLVLLGVLVLDVLLLHVQTAVLQLQLMYLVQMEPVLVLDYGQLKQIVRN
jgi:hypothetical protein